MAQVTLLAVVRAMWRISSWVKDLEGVCITYKLNYGVFSLYNFGMILLSSMACEGCLLVPDTRPIIEKFDGALSSV